MISHGHLGGAPPARRRGRTGRRDQCRPDMNGEGGEWAVSTAHEDKLRRLGGDDECVVESQGVVGCCQGRDDE
jgi:hypothetical protein